MNPRDLKDNPGPARFTARDVELQAECAKAAQCQPSPQMLLHDRARALRAEADRLDSLAASLPGVMSSKATDALVEILLRRPSF